jgi:hypothetical protein
MRRQASHLAPHRFVDPPRSFAARTAIRRCQSDSADDFYNQQRHIYRPDTGLDSKIVSRPALRLPAALPARARSGGGRNARATSTLARFRFPPAIHPRELPVCRQLAANPSFQHARRSNVFGEPTLTHKVAPSNKKTLTPCEQTVEDGTSLWNAEEKPGR